MKDLIIRIDEPKKTEIFEKVEDADYLIKAMQFDVEMMLQEREHEPIMLNTILDQIADDVEKATGERPVFGPWHKDDEGLFQIDNELLDFKSVNDYDKIIINWDL